MIKIKLMTFKSLTTIFIGFMFCFCLLSKQYSPLYEVSAHVPTTHQLDYDESDLDLNEIVNANDDFIMLPIIIALPILFLLLPVFSGRHYAQPIISAPKRPPSI